jgi:hypothetical protein
VADSLEKAVPTQADQERSLTPEGVSYRSEGGAVEAKPRTPHATTARETRETKPREERFLTAQTPFGMTKFFG